LLREDRLDSESGDEKDEGHCEASVVGVRVGIVMSVVEEKDGVGESDEADLERRKGFEDDVKRWKRWCRLRSCCCCLSSPLFVIITNEEGAQRGGVAAARVGRSIAWNSIWTSDTNCINIP
jgi:hypothetical protein